jgi:uncharacterized delta-60 repeat protein
MKKFILALMFLLVSTSFLSLNAQWAITYGGSGNDEANFIQQTSDGGYIVVGETSSFGAGGGDIWVLKLSSMGEIAWQKTYEGTSEDHARSIQQTNDGGYIVVGRTYSFGAGMDDIWILKLTSSGETEWQKTYGGAGSDSASSIQQTNDGGYVVAGSTLSFGAEGEDILILKLSSDGDIEWQKTYGGSKGDSASSIQQRDDGGYIVAGMIQFSSNDPVFWILELSSVGDIEWQKAYGRSEDEQANSFLQTSDGGYIVAGRTKPFGFFVSDVWILKLSSDGDIEWQKTYGASGNDEAYSIQQTNDGGYIVAGLTDAFVSLGDEVSDVWILKLFSDGDIEWQKTYGGSGNDEAHSIQQTSDGGYIVAGYNMSWGAGSRDFWVLKLSSDGDINPRCSFIRNSNAEVSDDDISSEVTTYTTPKYIDIIPQDTTITPQDTDATVYSLCSEKPLLGILASGRGTTVPAPGTYIHEPGTEVTITAFPEDGSSLWGWGGDASGVTNPITTIMDSDKSIRADFWHLGFGGGEELKRWGSCFIATAAYGSPLHPYVEILRDFRNTYLVPNKLGRKIVDLYYEYSPFVANIIAKHKALKVFVRIKLLPIIAISYSTLHFGPIITTAALIFIFSIPIFFIWRYPRRLKRQIRRKKISN